jgi:hypothetical protein
MLPIILPATKIMVKSDKEGRVVTTISFSCIPLRPIVPSHVCVDFEIIGVEKKIPGNDTETVSVLKKWSKDGVINACCFSEIAEPSRLNLPEFAAGQELILVVRNIYADFRMFTCAWLVQEKGS